MKRRAFQLLVLLMLGAIVNIAVGFTIDAIFPRFGLTVGSSYKWTIGSPTVAEIPGIVVVKRVGWPVLSFSSNEILWPGFAINTIFYAAMLWVVFFAPGMVRRYFRGRRGLCPACAYPIGTSPVCTECGRQLMATSTRP